MRNLVTLMDGTEADCASESWRHECEARAVLNMATKDQRRCYLYGYTDPDTKRTIKGVLQHRGEQPVKQLEETIRALWQQRKAAKLAG